MPHFTSPARRCARAMRSAAMSVALCSGCARMVTPAEQPIGAPFELAVGAIVQVAGTATRLQVVSIADSRCPSDVTCIAAGDAVVVIRRTGTAGSRTDTLRLRAEPHAATGDGGQTVELVDVRPYPRSTDTGREPVAVLKVGDGSD